MFCGGTAAGSASTGSVSVRISSMSPTSALAREEDKRRRADGFIRWTNLRLIGEIQIWLELSHKIYALLGVVLISIFLVFPKESIHHLFSPNQI